MATERKILLSDKNIDEIVINPHLDSSCEEELVTAFDFISFGSDSENFSSERPWQCGIFIPTVPQLLS